MTDLLTRTPAPPPPPSSARSRSVVLAGVEAAAMTAGFGLVAVALVVVLAWAADPRSGAGAVAALRTAGQIWLLAHHASLHVPSGHLGLVPLGLTVLPGALLVRAGRMVAHGASVRDLRTAGTATLSVAGSYGVLAALVSGLAATPTVHPAPLQALTGGFGVAALAGGAGILQGAGLVPSVWGRVSPGVQRVVAAGGAATAVILGAGALLALGALAAHGGRAAELFRSVSPGAAGGFALVLVCLAYAPTAICWGAAYAVGPGFAVGAGTAVAPAGVSLGALPAFPLLAALPSPGPAPLAAMPVLLTPVLAGLAAGWLTSRRPARSGRGWRATALRGLACGPVAGAGLAVTSWLASGPAGPGRLATAGPSAWQVGLAAAAEVGLLAAWSAAALTWWDDRATTGLRP